MNLRTIAALIAVFPLPAALSGCGPTEDGTQGEKSQHAAAAETGVAARLFEEITSSSGVNFQQACGDSGKYFFPEEMGSGVALLDYDRDDDLDIFVVQAAPGRAKRVGDDLTPSATSRLYRQTSPGRFEDVTAAANLEDHEAYGVGVAAGDVNNDGWPDLYVSKYGHDRLFLNRNGRFEDVTKSAGIDNPRWGTSACFLDYDRDGWLDLFVANYVNYYPSKHCMSAAGDEDYCSPSAFEDSPARLFRNVSGERAAVDSDRDPSSGEVRFRDVSLETGIDSRLGPGLGVLPADWNGDGWIDIYVANDGKANFLWINEEGKRFREDAISAGAAYDAAGRPQASMGVASGDVNGDGRLDLFLTHLFSEYSTLYLQVQPGIFEDRTVDAGLAAPTIPVTGFGTALADFDLDGDLDLASANGRVRRLPGQSASPASFWESYKEPSQLFLGRGDGTFLPVAAGQDAFLAEPHVMRGLAAGDLDSDGDLDLVTTEINGPARVFQNVSTREGNWLIVRAVDPRLGERDAYGALITVVAGQQSWRREVNPAFSYLSSSDPRVHFGLGKTDAVERIEVRWLDGLVESFAGVKANQILELRRGMGTKP